MSTVYVWGNGNNGQLGLGALKKEGMMKNYDEPTPVRLDTVPLEAGETVADVAAGQDHTLAVTSAGRLFAWGHNAHGKLGVPGLSDQDDCTTPRLVEALAGVTVVQAAVGDSHSVAVDDQGRVFTWGWGGSLWSGGGLLGHGDTASHTAPKLVESLVAAGVKVTKATAGELHTTLLTSDGFVLSCGVGEYGRLGLGDMASDATSPEPIEYLDDEPVVELVGGHAFTMARTASGRLWVWGRNDQGQLGQGGTISLDVYAMQADPCTIDAFEENASVEIKAIAAGHSHAALLTAGGDLWMWGMKTYLEPKKFDVPEPVAAVACGLNFTAALGAETGAVYTFGNGGSAMGHGDKKFCPQPKAVAALEGCGQVASLRCGHRHTFALVK